MDHKRKILFTDLDDTLLTRDKQLTPENAAAISQALDAGHIIAANTGRPLPSALPILERLLLNREGCFAITYNGGLIYDLYHKKVLYKKTLPLRYVRRIFQEAEAHGLYCQTYSDHALLCKNCTEETLYYSNRNQIAWTVVPDLPDSLTEEPVKALVIDLHDKNRLEAFRKDMESWTAEKLSIFFSNDLYLEHVAYGVSKGNALHFLCEYLQISLEQTIAAGDAENDIPMLEAAHIGVAMQNAAPAVKAAADYITRADCDNSGLREIIYKFMLF